MKHEIELLKELIGTSKAALKYLNHPEVKSVPFAVKAEVAADRLEASIREAEEHILKNYC